MGIGITGNSFGTKDLIALEIVQKFM